MSNQKVFGLEYAQWLTNIKEKIRQSRLKSALKLNTELLSLYWELGKAITEKQTRTNWGDKMMAQLAADLNAEFPEMKGFSLTNLKYIRRWYQFYASLSQQVVDQLTVTAVSGKNAIGQHDVGQLQMVDSQLPAELSVIPWGHHIQVFTRVETLEAAMFYIQQTAAHGWSRSVLVHQMESGLFHRKGQSQNNFSITLPAPQSELANELLKNPYNLDFLGLGDYATEKELEKSLMANIRKFLLELGTGFSFLGQQYHLQVGEKDYYIDLLFYHVRLHCYFVIELKVGEFKPEYAGKLEFYITVVDKQIKTPDDAPTIGLLLCKSVDQIIVEYSLNTKNKPIGVAAYRHSIPDEWKNELPGVEELRQEMEKEINARPIENKIETLKQLINKLGKAEMNVEKSDEVVMELLNHIIAGLIQKTQTLLAEIIPYFKKAFFTPVIDGFSKSAPSIMDLPSHNQVNEIGFRVLLDGFKKAGTNTFTVSESLTFFLDRYAFKIGQKREEYWSERLYDQPWSEAELEAVAERVSDMIIDSINSRLGIPVSG